VAGFNRKQPHNSDKVYRFIIIELIDNHPARIDDNHQEITIRPDELFSLNKSMIHLKFFQDCLTFVPKSYIVVMTGRSEKLSGSFSNKTYLNSEK
jgi:hypothetical protein